MSHPDTPSAAERDSFRKEKPRVPAASRAGSGTALASHRWRLFGLRGTVGGIFLYAGARKFGDPLGFADSLATFDLLPPLVINGVALSLPPYEVLLGILIVAGWNLRAASLGATVLAGIFVVFLGQGIARGLSLDCGCFGPGEPTAWSPWLSLARALFLGLASAWLWRQASVNSAPKSRAPCRACLP